MGDLEWTVSTPGVVYRGILKSGWFEIAGHRFNAEELDNIYLSKSRCVLVDGTFIRVPRRWKRRFLNKSWEHDFSGEITLYCESLNRDVTLKAGELSAVWRPRKK